MLQAEAVTTTPRTRVPHLAHPDAELLSLGAQLDIAMVREQALIDAATDENEATIMVIAEINVRNTAPIVDRIEKASAATMEGLLVKAKAIRWCHGGAPFNPLEDARTQDVRIMGSIIADLLAI